MTKPKITVVLPVWNESKYLPPCIDSISAQTYPNFEVIAPYRTSSDSTLKLRRSAGWTIVDQGPVPPHASGISVARAKGFAAATGEIIASTNADTVVPPDWLDSIAAAFSNPQVVGTYGPVYFIEGADQFFYRLMNIASYFFFSLTHLSGRDHTIGENFAVRKSAYLQTGGFNPKLATAEDVDLGYRIKQVGQIIFNPRLIVHTSNRRLARQKLRFFTHHIANYFRLTFFGSASSSFEPIR